MDVWMTWSKRVAKCHYCEQPIVVATPMVIGQTKKGDRTYRMYFHPQCWVDNGMAYLNNNPYTPHIRGRKRLSLSPEDTRKRYLLIRRYNRFKQRRNELTKFPDDILESIRLEEEMNKIAEDIKDVGGIPTGWAIEKEVLLHI